MSVDYNAILAVGFLVTVDEVRAAIEYKDAHGENGDDWFDDLMSDGRLIQFDCYRDAKEYLLAAPGSVHRLSEGECSSMMGAWSRFNFIKYKEFIEQFMRDFGPVVDMETHQLDIYMGLQVC